MTTLSTFANDGLTFDVVDSGGDGDVVILLHGFPQTKESWDGVIPRLADAGYRVLAPDQRGYSPAARPRGRKSYSLDRLLGDVLALADAAEARSFHLVGHDWGGAVAWAAATEHAGRLATVTSLATPHPRALLRSLGSSAQALQSWYILFFQLPALPEVAIAGAGAGLFEQALVRSGLPRDRADAYLRRLREGAAGPALNWYRGLPLRPARGPEQKVEVPALYIYGAGDAALSRRAADLTGEYVSGPYRYEVLDGVSHWIPEEVPDTVAALLVEHFGTHPAT